MTNDKIAIRASRRDFFIKFYIDNAIKDPALRAKKRADYRRACWARDKQQPR